MDVTYLNHTSNYITLNYTSNYSLYHKLLKCIVNIINYNLCYTWTIAHFHVVSCFFVQVNNPVVSCFFVQVNNPIDGGLQVQHGL